MDKQDWKCDGLLLIGAVIWGSAFIAQKVGMDYVGPFVFNGVRFLLGAAVLLPIVLKSKRPVEAPGEKRPVPWWGVIIAGLILVNGATYQQVGLYFTTAGKAGFITGMYVVLVPLLGLFVGHRPHLGTVGGAVLAVAGLYLLSVTEGLEIGAGDQLEIVSTVFWAFHVLYIGWLSPRMSAYRLAFGQFAICGFVSLAIGLIIEPITLVGLRGALPTILYAGMLSVGVGYTLQVVAQKKAHPAHASILMSLESVFAAIGGWLILNELLTGRQIVGCALMLAAMLISQLYGIVMRRRK